MPLQVLFGDAPSADSSVKGVDGAAEAVDASEAQLEKEMASEIGATVDLPDDAIPAELLATPSVDQQAQLDELQTELGDTPTNIWQITGAMCRVPEECATLASTCSEEQLLRAFEPLPRQCPACKNQTSPQTSSFLYACILIVAGRPLRACLCTYLKATYVCSVCEHTHAIRQTHLS